MLAGICGGLAVVAAMQWSSWYWVSRAESYTGQVAETGWIEDEQQWHRHHEALQRVRVFDPLNAQAYWQLGELEYWNAAGLQLWPDRRSEKLRTAEDQYVLAVLASPSNGELLARLAYRLTEINGSLPVELIRRAMEVAPYEPVVQYHLAALGMQFWEELDAGLKKSFQEMLTHAMGNYKVAAQIKKLARQRDRLDWLSAFDPAS